MTIKKGGLFLVGSAIAFCLCRMVSSMVNAQEGDGTDKILKMDLSNAIQHIDAVKLISESTSDTSEAILKSIGSSNLVGVKTNNFVITKTKTGSEKNQISSDSSNSNILGGIKNSINKGEYSSILGGEQNTNEGKYSTILGGKENTIEAAGTNYSTILGGYKNKIKGEGSVIAGGQNNEINGDYSVTVGSENKVTGNNSAALGNNSKVGANNSFLWTDGSHNDTLSESNVFAVVSEKGMVVNTNKAHTLAQLTIGGPLIIDAGTKDSTLVCNSANKGVMKVVNRDDGGALKCLCGCDGEAWHSLYGQGLCEKKCNVTLEPVCGEVYRCDNGSRKFFVGKCTTGKAVQGNGAYLVTKDNKVHRSCQTDDGAIEMCEKVATAGNTTQCGG